MEVKPVEVSEAEAKQALAQGVVSVRVVNLSGSPKDAWETPLSTSSGNRPWKKYYETTDDLPSKLNERARLSTTNSRILSDKTDYITGKGFRYEGTGQSKIEAWQKKVNNEGETLMDIHAKVSADFARGGVAYIELVKTSKTEFLFYHKDYAACRISNNDEIWVSSNFQKWNSKEYKPVKFAKFPNFALVEDRAKSTPTQTVYHEFERSIIQIKRYESGFPSYGLPDYFAAYASGWLDIDYWIPKYNFSRFKNGFNPSGLLVLVGQNQDEKAQAELVDEIVNNYTGEGMNSKLIVAAVNNESMKPVFTKFNDAPEGAFEKLQDMANENIIIAHGWHPSLLLQQPGKLSNASDILIAYEMAMLRVAAMQETITSAYRKVFNVFNISVDSISIINNPPVSILSQLNPATVLTVDEQRLYFDKEPLPNKAGEILLTPKSSKSNGSSSTN